MDKQKKNKVLRVASLALVLTLITTCLSAYTLAKYTTSVSGTDTARVAKLDFGASLEAMDERGTGKSSGYIELATTAVNLDIFATSYDTDDANVTAAGANVKTVVSNSTDNIIAPGVKGGFEIAFAGQSEVSLRVSLGITETNNAKVPMLYQYGTDYYSDQYTSGAHYFVMMNDGSTMTKANVAGDLDDLASAIATDIGIVDAGVNVSGLGIVKVDWFWPFEEYTKNADDTYTLITGTTVGTDAYDTALGVVGTDIVTLKIAATATQVD